MTFSQAMNIAAGYHERKKKEFEANILIMREPYALIYNMFAEKNKQKAPKDLFPLDIDRITTKQHAKTHIPASAWLGIFHTTFTDGE